MERRLVSYNRTVSLDNEINTGYFLTILTRVCTVDLIIDTYPVRITNYRYSEIYVPRMRLYFRNVHICIYR